MRGGAWRIARIAGVDVRIDPSWTFIALLIGYSFFVRIRIVYDEVEVGSAIALAAVGAIVFFGSVFVHELAHAVVSKAKGIHVHDITLFLFGGVTRADVGSRTPGTESLIAVVGPLTSLGIGAAFLGAASFADAAPEPIVGTAVYLGTVNLFLAFFNLLPGYPLDGGRLLRAALWRATGDPVRSTRIASVAGEVVGWLLVVGGVALVLLFAMFGGLWLAFIGWFLIQAARASYADVELRAMLEGVPARDVMAGDLVPIPDDATLQESVDEYFLRYDHSAFPVEREGRAIGLLPLRAVRRVPREDWRSRTAGDAMVPLGDEITVDPDAPMDRVLEKLQEEGRLDGGRVLVQRGGDVVGIITAGDLARWLGRRRRIEGAGASGSILDQAG